MYIYTHLSLISFFKLLMKDGETTIAFWDRLGISISGLCAVHCLFFPVAIALLPLWPMAESIHDWTHPVLFILIVPTVIFVLKDRRTFGPIGLYLFSGLIVVGAAWMLHDWIGDWGEAAVTITGSALLVRGHWINYQFHKKKHSEAIR